MTTRRALGVLLAGLLLWVIALAGNAGGARGGVGAVLSLVGVVGVALTLGAIVLLIWLLIRKPAG